MIHAAALVIAIVHVTVIDGTGAPPKPDQTVVIRGDKIAAVGDVDVPRDAQVVDGQGKFLIPGLWDMHTHVLTQPGKYFPKLLASGVTGIRNMHVESDSPMGTVAEARKLNGPRIVANGAIVDGPHPVWRASVVLGDAAGARRVVSELKRSGADFIKVYDFLPRDAYFALAAEAHRAHLPLVGHVPIFVTAEEAARSGQKSIEHLSGIFEACTSNGKLDSELKHAANLWMIAQQHAAKQMQAIVFQAASNYESSICKPLFEVFVEKGTWQCPTLVVLGQVQEAGLLVVREMHQAGVKLLAGTDAGNPKMEPGESLHRELELLVQAGLSPMEALQTATRNAAEFLGKLKEAGTVEKGKQADMVLLDADPLVEIGNTRRVAAVILRGKISNQPAAVQATSIHASHRVRNGGTNSRPADLTAQ